MLSVAGETDSLQSEGAIIGEGRGKDTNAHLVPIIDTMLLYTY